MSSLYKEITLYLENKTEPHPVYRATKLQEINSLLDYSLDVLHINCLEYVNNPLELLNVCCQKLAGNGQIIVEGWEIYSICRNIAVSITNIADINNLLYDGKTSSISMVLINQFLSDSGFKITDRNIDNQRFMIMGVKNGT